MEVLVIGAGASGLMAAITAARAGAKVTILEKGNKPGRKLSVTGNGKCNLTNLHMEESCFRGTDPEFVLPVLTQMRVADTLRFFSELGLYTTNRDGGIYPHSGQAAQVVQILTEEAMHQKVKCKYQTEIKRIEKKDGRFCVHTDGWVYEADTCILATGSPAAPETGANESGYRLAEAFGHTILPVYPVLNGMKAERSVYPKLAGLRCEGRISVCADGELLSSNTGELQFTTYGISGIPAFQVSHYAVKAWEDGKHVTFHVNFLPEFDLASLESYLRLRAEQHGHKTASSFLLGLFHQKLIDVLLLKAEIAPNKNVGTFQKDDIRRLTEVIYDLSGDMTGYMDLSHAQACTGGVSTAEIFAGTMESRLVRGLHFAGEIVDIDGACGGYNLQWAWSSGFAAGRHAAQE